MIAIGLWVIGFCIVVGLVLLLAASVIGITIAAFRIAIFAIGPALAALGIAGCIWGAAMIADGMKQPRVLGVGALLFLASSVAIGLGTVIAKLAFGRWRNRGADEKPSKPFVLFRIPPSWERPETPEH